LNNRGHTLIELIVAMGLFSLVLLATNQGTLWGARESTRVQEREKMQVVELAARLSFTDDSVIKQLAIQSGDELLKTCLLQPCQLECLNQEEWRPISWGQIKRNLITIDDGTVVDLGTHYSSQKGEWSECPIFKEAGIPVAPYFSAHCGAAAKARWRSDKGETLVIEISLGVERLSLNRNFSYRLPIAKDPNTQTCRKTAGVSCGRDNVFLTKVDIPKDNIECSDMRPKERVP